MGEDSVRLMAQGARDMLAIYERESELFRQVMSYLTPENIETLREIATWDEEIEPRNDPCPRRQGSR